MTKKKAVKVVAKKVVKTVKKAVAKKAVKKVAKKKAAKKVKTITVSIGAWKKQSALVRSLTAKIAKAKKALK